MVSAVPPNERGHLFGASGHHARVVVMTVTEKEMPIAREVFSACGSTVEIGTTTAYTSEQFVSDEHLPFVLVRATDRGGLLQSHDIEHWIREFRPQAFLLVGTAGGIWRPVDTDRTNWKGPHRGDVVVSEYVHYGDYRKVTVNGDLLRHHRLEQPANYLLAQSRPLILDPDLWHRHLGATWEGASMRPSATEEEIVVGEQIQDNPMHATQQFLMQTFDRAGAAEMESAGLAAALHSARTTATYAPMYLSIRGISDLIWACGTDGPLTEDDVAQAKKFDASEMLKLDRKADGESTKSAERDSWSPRAAAAASAFALGLVERLVRGQVGVLPGHPAIPAVQLFSVGARG